jgi:hypothetical protein
MFILITKLFLLLSLIYCLDGGTVAITAVAYTFLTCEELRHTLHKIEIEIEIVYNITSKNRLESLGPPFCYAIQDLEA